MKRLAIPIAALISIASCVPGGKLDLGRPVREAYEDRGEPVPVLRVLETGSPLSHKRPVPIIEPPEVFAVYVPTHVDAKRDMMVGEHFLFIKLRDSRWLSERLAEPDLELGEAVARDEELRLLRQRITVEALERLVIPHKGATRP